MTASSSNDRSGMTPTGIHDWDLRVENYSIRLKRRYLFATEQEAALFESRVRSVTRWAEVFVIAHKMAGVSKVCVILRTQPERADIAHAAQIVSECEALYQERFARRDPTAA